MPRWLLSLVLAVAAFLVYNANGREAYPTGDSRPTALLGFSILFEGDLDINEYHPPEAGVSGPIRLENGRVFSNYSPLPAFLALPIYLLAAPHRAEIDGDIFRWTPFFSKLAGSIFAALAVVAFFLAAEQVASQRAALITTIVLAFGSPFWVSGSQTLGQHGLTVLLASLALFALARLERTDSWRWSLAAGAITAVAMGIRLSNVVIFLTFLGYLLLYHRRRALVFAAPVAVVGVPALVFLLGIVGGVGGGLEAFGFIERIRTQLTGSFVESLPGLLLSPGEGLFVWSPVLLLLLVPVAALLSRPPRGVGERGPRRHAVKDAALASPPAPQWEPRRKWRFLVLCLVTFTLMFLLYARYVEWWGGRTYGPRYLTDALPFLLVPAAAGLEPWLSKRWFWTALVMLLGWSAAVQAVGAFRYPCTGRDPLQLRLDEHRIWDWKENDFLLCSQSVRRPPDHFKSAWRLLRMTVGLPPA